MKVIVEGGGAKSRDRSAADTPSKSNWPYFLGATTQDICLMHLTGSIAKSLGTAEGKLRSRPTAIASAVGNDYNPAASSRHPSLITIRVAS